MGQLKSNKTLVEANHIIYGYAGRWWYTVLIGISQYFQPHGNKTMAKKAIMETKKREKLKIRRL